MISNILKSTRGKPCTCPTGKICTACKSKKIVHPQVIVEEPQRLPAPVSITYYKPPKKPHRNNSTQGHYMEKPRRWKFRTKKPHETQTQKSTNLCRWYKRRRAYNQLLAEHKKEQEILKQRKRDEYERERVKDFIQWEKERQKALALPPDQEKKLDKHQPQSIKSLPPPNKGKKSVSIKDKSASVKPCSNSKCVNVKRCNIKDNITKRFVNCCYKLCCQFYCYLTCIILIVLAFMYIFQ